MRILSFLLLLLLIGGTAAAQSDSLPVNLGKFVNSKYDESAPCISPDGKTLYFIREVNLNGSIMQYIWYSRKDSTGAWGPAKKMEAPLNTRPVNAIVSVSPDGRTMYIKGAYENGKFVGNGYSEVKMLPNGRWGQPNKLDIKGYDKMDRGKYAWASVIPSGQVMFLSFSEQKGATSNDIYISKKQTDGSWSKPVKLIAPINTNYDENGPLLALDGESMYFFSNRPGGKGKMDLYVCRRLDDTYLKWSKPENLGSPINTRENESYYCLDATGAYAYLSVSNGQYGGLDLVQVNLRPSVRAKPVVLVKVVVMDTLSGQMLEKVTLTTKSSNEQDSISRIIIDNTFGAIIMLNTGSSYTLIAERTDCFSVTKKYVLDTNSKYSEIVDTIYMSPIRSGQAVRLNHVYFKTGEAVLQPESYPELDRVVKMLRDNPSFSISISGHTDSIGTAENNRVLSQSRADAVKNYLVSKGIAEQRLKAVGYGETMPIADNGTDEGRAINRRVEFIRE